MDSAWVRRLDLRHLINGAAHSRICALEHFQGAAVIEIGEVTAGGPRTVTRQ